MLPNREVLRTAFDQAVLEINQRRDSQQLISEFYRQIGDSVFEAGHSALVDANTPQRPEETKPPLHCISAPAGSGKTSFAMAFAAAVVRTDPAAGVMFVVDQIRKADELYRDLSKLLPHKCAVWTMDHNRERIGGVGDQVKVKTPAARFNKRDLKHYAVIVITHRSFQTSPWLRLWNPGGSQEAIPRQLKIIDERIDEYQHVDIDLGDATKLRDFIVNQGTEVDQDDATAGARQARAVAAMDALVEFMIDRDAARDGRDLITPNTGGPDGENAASWNGATQALQWFTTREAEEYAKSKTRGVVTQLSQLLFSCTRCSTLRTA
jgi:hypothetical protein